MMDESGWVKRIMGKLENSKFAPLIQFIKFGIVGASNTAISYGIEMLGYYFVFKDTKFPEAISLLNRLGISATDQQVKVFVVTAIAFIVSVANSYFWNHRYVFKSEGKKTAKQHLVALLKMAGCYALTGLILSPVIKIMLSNSGMAYWLASICSLIIGVPLNYLLNKIWAFK